MCFFCTGTTLRGGATQYHGSEYDRYPTQKRAPAQLHYINPPARTHGSKPPRRRREAHTNQVEINNGRLAMLGLFACLSESKGLIVPPLDAIEGFPKYDGDIMIPFSSDFHIDLGGLF